MVVKRERGLAPFLPDAEMYVLSNETLSVSSIMYSEWLFFFTSFPFHFEITISVKKKKLFFSRATQCHLSRQGSPRILFCNFIYRFLSSHLSVHVSIHFTFTTLNFLIWIFYFWYVENVLKFVWKFQISIKKFRNLKFSQIPLLVKKKSHFKIVLESFLIISFPFPWSQDFTIVNVWHCRRIWFIQKFSTVTKVI